MAWWKTAKPGDPIVCVETTISSTGETVCRGRVYIIREIVVVPCGYAEGGEVGVLLEGIKRPTGEFGDELGFLAEHFRPAKTTDLPESLIKCLDAPMSGKREAVS